MNPIVRSALLGAVGCLLGALLAELVIRQLPRPEPPAPAREFTPALAERLRAANAQTGDIQVALMWNEANALRLSCAGPDASPPPEVDVSPDGAAKVTSLHWRPGSAEDGRYVVSVTSAGAAAPRTTFVCAVKAGEEVHEFSGSIAGGASAQPVYEFQYYRPSSSLAWSRAVRSAAWNTLLGLGLCLALLGSQRAGVAWRHGLLLLAGVLTIGLLVGGGGQWLWEKAGSADVSPAVVRVGAWGLLGAGLAWLIPFVQRRRPGGPLPLLGAVGGLLGGLAYEAARHGAGELAGRLVGAAGLGLSLGLATALAPPAPLAAPAMAPAAPATAFSLRLSTGRLIPLAEGQSLAAAELPGLTPRWWRRSVARVARNPARPDVLGLTNRSQRAWSAVPAGGAKLAVGPGRSVRLAVGTSIDFGDFTAEVV